MVTPKELNAVVFAAVFLIPVVIAILSAGIAWGVTTATIKTLKGAIGEVEGKVDGLSSDFWSWKQNRTNLVMTHSDCALARQSCVQYQDEKFAKFSKKLDEYIEKSDIRWEKLLVAITSLQGSGYMSE